MDLRQLGMTGAAVSAYALGTMTFGAEADEAACHAMLDRYLETGGNFVDTADVYADGASEEIIGRWLEKSGRRDEIVLATKARFRTSPAGSCSARRSSAVGLGTPGS
jgi:aryl-alcohol dehydrogenase-like predicted oxidoreductase